MHILLVEDDALVGAGIRSALETVGYTVDWSTSGQEARLALNAVTSDIAILDLGLPDMDGVALLRDWRKRGVALPVLVLTARDGLAERVSGLQAGADDYLLKPFDLDELIARVQALLRRAGGHAGPIVEHGPITLDPTTQTVYCEEREVELTRREYALLSKLLHARRSILTAEQLKDALYGIEAEVESNAINVHIYHLRRKLGAGLVRTVRGLGYRLGNASDIGKRSTP